MQPAHLTLVDLVLPIIVSGVAAFLMSFVLWAALPFHRGDWTPLDDDGPARAAVRQLGLAPGTYFFPWAKSQKDNCSPDMKAKMEEGPIGILTIIPPKPSMARNMALTVLSFTVAAALMAYLGAATLPRGTSFGKVLQVEGTAGVLAYCFAFLPNYIWFSANRRRVVTSIIDGVIYGMTMGLVFAWLWPK